LAKKVVGITPDFWVFAFWRFGAKKWEIVIFVFRGHLAVWIASLDQ
jgi:hypothetical protein